MSRISLALEKGFVVSALFLFAGSLIPLLRQQGRLVVDLASGDPILQGIFLVIYGMVSLLVILRWRRFSQIVVGDKLLVLLIGIALVSVLWSGAPEVTLRRGAALLGTTLFGIYLVISYSVREQLQLLAWALGIAATLSLLFVVVLPDYGISHGLHEGAWQGIYLHKNTLGRIMALGALVFLLFSSGSSRHWWLGWCGLGLSVVLLLFSDSKTALVIFLIFLVLLPLYRSLRWHYTLAAPFLIVSALLGGVVVLSLLNNAEAVLNVLGRDITLSNRADLWDAAIAAIWERPWLGYGYSGFWLGWEGDSASLWMLGWDVESADNGFLDLWLDLGILGVLVFAWGYISAYLRAVVWVRATGTVEGLWPLVYLTFMLLYNVTEGSILVQNSIFWVLYVTAVLSTVYRPSDLDQTRSQRFPIRTTSPHMVKN